MKKTFCMYLLLIHVMTLSACEKKCPGRINAIKKFVVGAARTTLNCTDSCMHLLLEQKLSPKNADKGISCCCLTTGIDCCYCCQGPVATPCMAAAAVVAAYETGLIIAQPQNNAKDK